MIVRNMHEKISDICIRWQSDCPFFAEFLLRFKYKPMPEIGTAGVSIHNGRIHLAYAPDFIEKLSSLQLEGTLVHEIMHILNKFHERVGDRHIFAFNVAQDACINETVVTSTIGGRQLELFKGVVTMEQMKEMGYKGESISEPVYDFIMSKAEQISINSKGAGAGGNGKEENDSTCPDCGGTGMKDNKTCPSCGGTGSKDKKKKQLNTTDNHGQMNKRLSEMDKQVIEETVNHAKSRSWGSMSGNLKSKCEDLIKTKRIPWKQKLRMCLSRYVNSPGNIQRNSWAKRNRRNLPLPGIKKLSNKVLVSVDTSGSIDDDDLQKFFGQIEKIVKDFTNLIVIEWDTKVQRHYTYNKGDWKKIEVQGRGGTDCQDLYDYVYNNLRKYAVILVNFTDGYFDLGINHYNIPTVWAVVNNNNFKPGFGQIILIEDEKSK